MIKIYPLHEKYCMMPETDCNCPFTHWEEGEETYYCRLYENIVPEAGLLKTTRLSVEDGDQVTVSDRLDICKKEYPIQITIL
jgi:hypothetical protein